MRVEILGINVEKKDIERKVNGKDEQESVMNIDVLNGKGDKMEIDG